MAVSMENAARWRPGPGARRRAASHGAFIGLLISAAVLSLFIYLRYKSGFTLVRPFEILVPLIFLLTLATKRASSIPLLSNGFLILLPFFFLHAASAFTLSKMNGLRETLQAGAVTLFAWSASQNLDVLDYKRMGRTLLIGLTLIAGYLSWWGLFASDTMGWKLPDAKTSLTFLPLTLSLFLVFVQPKDRWQYFIAWLVLGAVFLFSGERKALLVYLVNSAIIASRGRWLNYLPIVAALVVVLGIFARSTSDTYISRQITTILSPFTTGKYQDVVIGRGLALGDTWSNAQRAFSVNLSTQLIEDHPVFGIGTNGYAKLIDDRYWYLPEEFQTGIHNEFQRVWTENGIIGFLCYLAIWFYSFARLLHVLHHAYARHLIDNHQRVILPLLCYVPCFLYLLSEATGTHSFVTLIFLSLLPDFLRYALPQYAALKARKAERASVAIGFSHRPTVHYAKR